MLKSEAEKLFQRCCEESKAEFTEEQKQCIVQAMMKICSRIVEEAMASNSSNRGSRGGRQGYFAD
ncbi:MAG: hypothetical protein K2X27_14975 [Candidatus Obscuribacterales bacterium]|nr:hypothetical protein [Candidatus Obscuribacterales bacterium]